MFWNIVKVIAYLCVCVFVIWLAYRVSKGLSGRVGGGTYSTKYMRHIDRMALSRDSAINIVQVGERYMLIGVSGGRVEMLCELKSEDLHELQSSDTPTPYTEAVGKAADVCKNALNMLKRKKNKNRFSEVLKQNVDEPETGISDVDRLIEQSERHTDRLRSRTMDKRGENDNEI